MYDLKIDKSIFKIFYNNYDINLLKYQVVNQISIKYKSQISPNSNFVVDDLVQFSKKKFKKNSLFLFYYGLKQFFKYFTLIFVRAKRKSFGLGNNLDLLITNSDHFKKLSKSHLSCINRNFIIFNYDNPFVINLVLKILEI